MIDYSGADFNPVDFSTSFYLLHKVVIAKQTASFASTGINGTNISVIFKIGIPLKPFIPDNLTNAITGFEVGSWGYYIIQKEPLDLSDYVIPPINN